MWTAILERVELTMPDPIFSFRHPVEVRFKDVDVGGHAHHSHALVYFEEARAAYWSRVTGRQGLDGIDYILAEASVRYHQRVFWPQTLDVGVRVSILGRKHFEMEYDVRSAEGDSLVTGRTVQFMYDYEESRTRPVPDEVRAAMESLDGPFDRRGRAAE